MLWHRRLVWQGLNIYQNIQKIYRLLFIILILNNKFTNRYTDLEYCKILVIYGFIIIIYFLNDLYTIQAHKYNNETLSDTNRRINMLT